MSDDTTAVLSDLNSARALFKLKVWEGLGFKTKRQENRGNVDRVSSELWRWTTRFKWQECVKFLQIFIT